MKKKVCYVLSLLICLVLGGISSYFIFNNPVWMVVLRKKGIER